MVYDNKFQTVMGGYGANDSIATHVWESLVNNNSVDNSIDEIIHEEAKFPQLYQEWLTTSEQEHRRERNINSEVMRKIH